MKPNGDSGHCAHWARPVISKHAVSTAGALFRRPERRSVSSRSFVGDDLAQVVDALE